MTPDLRGALAGVARAFADAHEPWWIITGAAAALHGAPGRVGDVDVQASKRDAARVLGHARPGIASDRYRSAVFGTLAGLPLPIEVMAGFDLMIGGTWRRVAFGTRVPVVVDGATLLVPDRAELAHWLTAIGRPKDLARARWLA